MKFFLPKNFIYLQSPSSQPSQGPSGDHRQNLPTQRVESTQPFERKPQLAKAQEMFLATMTPKQAEHIFNNYESMLPKMNPKVASDLLGRAIDVYTKNTKINHPETLNKIFQAMKKHNIWNNLYATRQIMINILRQPEAAKLIAQNNQDLKTKDLPPKLWQQIQTKASQLIDLRQKR